MSIQSPHPNWTAGFNQETVGQNEIRRDIAPHNGAVILSLAIVTYALFFVPLIGQIVGSAIGVVALRMGKHDLRLIRMGEMDPDGEKTLHEAMPLATAGLILNIVAFVSIAGLFLVGCLSE